MVLINWVPSLLAWHISFGLKALCHSIKSIFIHYVKSFQSIKSLSHQVHSSFLSISFHSNLIQTSFHSHFVLFLKQMSIHYKDIFLAKFVTVDFWSIVDFLVNQLIKVNSLSLDSLKHDYMSIFKPKIYFSLKQRYIFPFLNHSSPTKPNSYVPIYNH